LTGHVALFVSMWLHARHVLRCTAEPAPRLKSTWRIPRPHFRLPRRRLTQARSESAPVDPAAPSVERTSKPRIRLDNRHREPVPQVGAPARIESSGGLEQSRVISPITLESQRIGPTDSDDSATTSLHPTTAVHATTCEAASAESEEASEEGSSRPELRGLSKKQRRRLMQELRDRERESRR
jgi:hypothetical protein